MNILVELLLAYLIYRFIAGFLVPVYRTTRHMRQQFHDMNGRPPADGPAPDAPHSAGTSTAGNKSSNQQNGGSKVGEYIDFEEVK